MAIRGERLEPRSADPLSLGPLRVAQTENGIVLYSYGFGGPGPRDPKKDIRLPVILER